MDRWLTERILKLAYDLEMDLITKDMRSSHLDRIDKLLKARDKLRETGKKENGSPEDNANRR